MNIYRQMASYAALARSSYNGQTWKTIGESVRYESASPNSLSDKLELDSILLVGLDAAGKTTMLYSLAAFLDIPIKNRTLYNAAPTIGYSLEHITMCPPFSADDKPYLWMSWDCGGGDKLSPLWNYFLQRVKAVIWLADCLDYERNITYAAEDLMRSNSLRFFLETEKVKDLPLLILLNKFNSLSPDLPPRENLVSPKQFLEQSGIEPFIEHRPVRIQMCSTFSLMADQVDQSETSVAEIKTNFLSFFGPTTVPRSRLCLENSPDFGFGYGLEEAFTWLNHFL